MKTLEEYMDDPEIAGEPNAMREIHAIRLKIHDERQGLSPAEYNAVVNEQADAFLASNVKMSLGHNG